MKALVNQACFALWQTIEAAALHLMVTQIDYWRSMTMGLKIEGKLLVLVVIQAQFKISDKLVQEHGIGSYLIFL